MEIWQRGSRTERKGRREKKKERSKERKEEERKIQHPTGLYRSNGESSVDQGVSSSTLQEVGVSHTLVISCLRVIQWPMGLALTVGLVLDNLDRIVGSLEQFPVRSRLNKPDPFCSLG